MAEAAVDRNKETGEFSCVFDRRVLATGKSSAAIRRVHDLAEAINDGGFPHIDTVGSGAERIFKVRVGLFTVLETKGAIKAYRELDKYEFLMALRSEQIGHLMSGSPLAPPLSHPSEPSGIAGDLDNK